MATTTNYGWTTPDDTALVKDGAAAIRTLGTSVDTTTKALNPSTTLGDIEYRSSTANTNTRLGIGSSGQVLTVAGGVPTWATSDDANAIQNALLTTTGDTIYASGASTPARLGIGSTGNVLTVAGGVPTWAAPAAGGAYTLLSTTSLTGASTTISSISQSYTDLYVVVDYMYFTAGGSGTFSIRPNAETALTNLSGLYFTSASAGSTDFRGNTTVSNGGGNIQGNSPSNIFVLKISQYSNSNVVKALEYYGGYTDSSSYKNGFNYAGYFRSETAITSLVFVGSTNFGSQYAPPQVNVYGVK